MALKRTKIINRSRIMREIWINREISRTKIARSLNLDKSTVSNNVNELLDRGVIVESSEADSGPQGGRKPIHIKLNKGYGCVLGIEITPDSYTSAAVDLEGEILYSRFERTRVGRSNLKEEFAKIVDLNQAELTRKGINLLGIGVAVSGVVDSRKGIIKFSIPLEITRDYEFYREAAHQYDVPIFIDNDANACVWGELAFHRRKELRDFIFLLLEFHEPVKEKNRVRVSVGIGIVINGKVHHGHDCSAGEFRSILGHKKSPGQFSLTEEEEELLVKQDPKVKNKFLHELGSHLGLLVNTFNLTHIILGGDFERYHREVFEIFEEEIRYNWPCSYPYAVGKNIWLSSFGDKAVAYGAAGMVLNKLFNDEGIQERSVTF